MTRLLTPSLSQNLSGGAACSQSAQSMGGFLNHVVCKVSEEKDE